MKAAPVFLCAFLLITAARCIWNACGENEKKEICDMTEHM